MTAMTARNKSVLLAGVAVLGMTLGTVSISGCGGGGSSQVSSPTRDAPTDLFATWRVVSVTGGFSGNGFPVQQETRFTFSSDGTATRQEGDQITFSGRYQVVRTTRKFGQGDLPVLEYLPRGYTLALVITRVDATHLDLAQEAAEGYDYSFERVL